MGEIEYFDISSVWTMLMDFFAQCIGWLFSHGFTVYDHSFSFGEVIITATVLTAVFWTFLPWFDDDHDDE